MSLEFKIWLYGTRADKSKKTLSRIADKDIAKAKGFHVFFKESSDSQWLRLTDEIEIFPSGFKSKTDKQIYIDSFIDALEASLAPKPKAEAKTKPKSATKKKPTPPVEKPKKKKAKELNLPELPKPPRVTLTKKQFMAQMSRILYDELDLENMKWSEARIDNFINKMWKSYSHAPHLVTSEQFRRSLVTKEIKRIKDKKLRKKEGEMDEAFRKQLLKREVSLDPQDVGGDVKVVFKEVFNTQGMEKPSDLTMKTLQDGLIVDKERQSAFAQIHVEYDKLMAISKEQLLANDKIANMAFDKTRADIEKLFDQAIEKGLFKGSDMPEYSIRLLVPLVNGKGDIPSDYMAKKGKKRTGHGFSTIREKIKNKKDLKKVLDNLFASVRPALARYMKLNKSAGFMISGFTIERLIR
jgi:hypothetical protein